MLLVDAGNSTIKAQWWRESVLEYSFSCRIEEGWQSFFEARLAEIEADYCHYSCGQVDALESELLGSVHQFFQADNIHRFASLESCLGVRNAYQSPGGLGVDRWLCLLAAARLVSQDVIVVDAGSAITVDLMRGDGQHLGGAILPGFNTSLAHFKRILHRVDFDHPDIGKNDEPGCSTEACIQINYPSTDEANVERLIDRWFERLTPGAALIVTGGDASRVKWHRGHNYRVVPDLVFKGMRRQLENQ